MVQRRVTPGIDRRLGAGGTAHEAFGMSAPGSPPLSHRPRLRGPDLADVAIPGGRDAVIPSQIDGTAWLTASEPDQCGWVR